MITFKSLFAILRFTKTLDMLEALHRIIQLSAVYLKRRWNKETGQVKVGGGEGEGASKKLAQVMHYSTHNTMLRTEIGYSHSLRSLF